MLNNLEEWLKKIAIHNSLNPTHGFNCVCMDQFIREFRALFTVYDSNVQNRINYIIRTALS